MHNSLNRFVRSATLVGLAGFLAAAAGACGSSDTPSSTSAGSQGASTGSSGAGGSGGAGTGGGSAGASAGGAGGGSSGSGGAGTAGGAGGTAGTTGTAGSAGKGGTAGSTGTAGSAGSGGNTGTAGSGGGGGRDGGAGTSGSGGTGGGGTGDGGTAKFSFFATSFAALQRLSGKQDGFGGDLRFGKADGLTGADEICRQIAETAMPGNGKTWHAFLSVTKGPSGSAVNAIDRVGEGPWYDRRGRLLTMNKAGLLQTRPQGADPIILNDLPNEDGVPNHNPGTGIVDNHNFLTGSTDKGVATSNLKDTCQDWTSSMSSGGTPRCGVTWPRSSLTNWIYALNEGGCAPGATPPGAEGGPSGTVGALGGYGGFYCFALTP